MHLRSSQNTRSEPQLSRRRYTGLNMNSAEIRLFFTALGEMFLKGQSKALSDRCEYPLAVYLPDELVVFRNTAHLTEYLDRFAGFLREQNVQKVAPTDIVILDATPGRALISLRWAFMDRRDKPMRYSHVEYVLRRDQALGDLRIEMVNYSVLGFPQFAENLFSA